MTRPFSFMLVLTFASLPILAAEPPEEGGPPLDLVFPEYFGSPEDWRGMQSIQADEKGRVFLLRTETMEEYPVGSDGKLQEPKELQSLGVEPPRDIRLAFMGSERGDWFMIGHEVYLFARHRHVPIERGPKMIFQATMVDDEPYALLDPWEPGKEKERPLLVRWTGTDWDVVAKKIADPAWNPMEGWRQWAALLVPGESSDLWLVYVDQPKIERFHARTGKLEMELSIDPEADFSRPAAEIAADLAEFEKKQMATDPTRRVTKREVHVAETRTAHHAAALSPDRTLFVLAADPEVPEIRLLRRWNSTLQVLEEIAIALDVSGIATMAFGRDGLHIAQFDTRRGRAFIDHEMLETAAWRPVTGVLVDGLPVASETESPADDTQQPVAE